MPFQSLIAFLRSTDLLLKYFGLPLHEDRTLLRDYSDIDKPISPLAALEDIFADPLWYLLKAVKEKWDTNLYVLELPSPKMDGFACWLDDENVPNPKASKRHAQEMDELTRTLAEFELDAFGQQGER